LFKIQTIGLKSKPFKIQTIGFPVSTRPPPSRMPVSEVLRPVRASGVSELAREPFLKWLRNTILLPRLAADHQNVRKH
jgi:hypothetical protein